MLWFLFFCKVVFRGIFFITFFAAEGESLFLHAYKLVFLLNKIHCRYYRQFLRFFITVTFVEKSSKDWEVGGSRRLLMRLSSRPRV